MVEYMCGWVFPEMVGFKTPQIIHEKKGFPLKKNMHFFGGFPQFLGNLYHIYVVIVTIYNNMTMK